MHLGDDQDVDGVYAVEVYDTDPEDKVIVFGCGFGDFIDLWLDGELLRRLNGCHGLLAMIITAVAAMALMW